MILRTNKIGISIQCLILSLLSLSCYQDDSNFTPNPPQGDIQADFLDQVSHLDETATLLVNEENKILTRHNTIITIPPLAFADQQGNPITDAIVYFTYTELKEKGEMIQYNKPTVTENDLLESAGVYHIDVRSTTGLPLVLQAGKSIKIQTPSLNTSNEMQLFNLIGTETDERLVWNAISSSPNGPSFVSQNSWTENINGELISGTGYEFDLNSLDWINCDDFLEIAPEDQTNLCVNLPEGYNDNNTIVFASFHNYNSVIALYDDSSTNQFCDAIGVSPVGENITYIAISAYDSDSYQLGVLETTIQRDRIETILMKPVAIQEIMDRLSEL